jgi:hypothetical protein
MSTIQPTRRPDPMAAGVRIFARHRPILTWRPRSSTV